ncbi:hypothetical protein AXG93_1409s1270 [Marchantia polymorpha subsp. ruderalis]|uniref:Uncharacterized protein n=1 Tax=Marchantia polymorpha subsp. ruderalis TaxID=1480154 RepID=A0A176WHZ9_MARPO|nr:hypothetical protein AXG93_1409s1270 [Marchantia polymorpha subsp. ruderalis]
MGPTGGRAEARDQARGNEEAGGSHIGKPLSVCILEKFLSNFAGRPSSSKVMDMLGSHSSSEGENLSLGGGWIELVSGQDYDVPRCQEVLQIIPSPSLVWLPRQTENRPTFRWVKMTLIVIGPKDYGTRAGSSTSIGPFAERAMAKPTTPAVEWSRERGGRLEARTVRMRSLNAEAWAKTYLISGGFMALKGGGDKFDIYWVIAYSLKPRYDEI